MSVVPESRSSGSRVDVLDAARGACLVSMVFGHIANGTLVSTLIHLPLWANGAMGFVLVSGMVLALVRKPKLQRGGQMWAVTKASWTRSRDLWLIAVALAFATLFAREFVGDVSTIPSIEAIGSTAAVARDVLLLQSTIQYIDVLTVYVFLLIVAPLSLLLLNRRHGAVVGLFLALSVYVVDWWWPIEFQRTYNHIVLDDGEITSELVMVPARWLLLFVIGMTLGWHWKRTVQIITRTPMKWALFAATIAFTFLARFHQATDQPPIPEAWIDRATIGPLSFVFGVVAVLSLVLVLERRPDMASTKIEVVLDRAKGFLAEIGRHSLDTYLIHVVVLVTANLAMGLPLTTPIALSLSVLSLVSAMYWARSKEHRVARKHAVLNRGVLE